MGASCCSHAKEPVEITILKPESNVIASNTNKEGDYNNNFQIIDLEQNLANQNQNILTTNNSEQPLDININSYQNNTTPLTQKEIDDILNQAFSNPNNAQPINNNISNDNNNIININNNIESTNQYQNIDLNNFYQNQNQNQNNQNIPLEQEIDKFISTQPINQNEAQKPQNNAELNIEEILKQNSNNTNTDYDIEELLKNTESKANNQIDSNNNNLNLDVFFNQTGNAQISDEFINKLFETTDKRSNNKNPLYLSQQAHPVQFKEALPVNNQYYSPGNSPQRSGVQQNYPSLAKQFYEIK